MTQASEAHTQELQEYLHCWQLPGGTLAPEHACALLAWSGTPDEERKALKASIASTQQQVEAKPLAPNQRAAMRVGSTASSTSSAASPDTNNVDHVHVFLAGVPVGAELVDELARLVDDDTLADRLENAYGREVKVLALDIPERETIIRAQRATKLSEFGRTDAS